MLSVQTRRERRREDPGHQCLQFGSLGTFCTCRHLVFPCCSVAMLPSDRSEGNAKVIESLTSTGMSSEMHATPWSARARCLLLLQMLWLFVLYSSWSVMSHPPMRMSPNHGDRCLVSRGGTSICNYSCEPIPLGGPPSAYFSCTRQAFFECHTAFALLVHVPRPALIGGRILRFGPNCWWVQEEYALPRHRSLVASLCSAWFVFPADAEETFQLFQQLVAASFSLNGSPL